MSANSATTRKLRAATAASPISPVVLEALGALAAIDSSLAAGARRGLRPVVEGRALALDRRLLGASGELRAELEGAERELDALCEASGTAVARLQTTRAATEVLLSQTSQLQEQVSQAKKQERLAGALAEALQLSAEDEATLNAPQDAPLSLDALLGALDRVASVGERARHLEGGALAQLGRQASARMDAYEERGYASLFRWLAAEVCGAQRPDTSRLLRCLTS